MARPAPPEAKGQVLPDNQIAGWAKAAGFPADQIATAVAVALAESSGRLDAVSVTGDYGLWQINERMHPEMFRDGGGFGDGQWWGQWNAQMAFKVWKDAGSRWTPWVAFNSGAYKLFLPRAQAAAGNPSITGIGPTDKAGYREVIAIPSALNEIGNAVKGVSQAFNKAGQWIGNRDNWIRVAQVAVGGGLLVMALNIVAQPYVGKVAGPVAAALTKGKIK